MDRTLVVAHRGVPNGVAENSLESFAKAIDIGADMIEFDIRRTRDGQLIAFHDAQINGTAVADLTLDQIASAAGTRPPLLADVLEHCAGRIKLDAEVKEDGYVRDITDLVRKHYPVKELVVTSLIGNVLVQAKALLPGVKTGLLLGRPRSMRALLALIRELYRGGAAEAVGADYIAPHWILARLGVLRRASASGLHSFVWTVNSERQIRAFAADPRVSAVITDRSELALAIVNTTRDLKKDQ